MRSAFAVLLDYATSVVEVFNYDSLPQTPYRMATLLFSSCKLGEPGADTRYFRRTPAFIGFAMNVKGEMVGFTGPPPTHVEVALLLGLAPPKHAEAVANLTGQICLKYATDLSNAQKKAFQKEDPALQYPDGHWCQVSTQSFDFQYYFFLLFVVEATVNIFSNHLWIKVEGAVTVL